MSAGAELGVDPVSMLTVISEKAMDEGPVPGELQLSQGVWTPLSARCHYTQSLWNTPASFLDPLVADIGLLLILFGLVVSWLMTWAALGCTIIAFGILTLWLARELAVAPCCEELPESALADELGYEAVTLIIWDDMHRGAGSNDTHI